MKFDLSKEFILSISRNISHKDKNIVYFLINKNKIVYVGMTSNIFLRLSDHRLITEKIFDSYSFLVVPRKDIRKIEKYFIDKFKPKYNGIICGINIELKKYREQQNNEGKNEKNTC